VVTGVQTCALPISKYFDELQARKKTEAEGAATSKAMEGLDLLKMSDKATFIKRLPNTMSVGDKTKLADSLWKTSSGLTSQAGRKLSDRAKLVAEYGEGSTQVKEFDKAAAPKPEKGTNPTRASLSKESQEVDEDGKPTEEAAAAKKALDDMDTREIKIKKDTQKPEKSLKSLSTIYGPGGTTKKVEVRDNYEPPKGWSLKKPDAGDAIEAALKDDKAPMKEMPPADKHKDKVIVDTETKKRYKSDGKKWVEISGTK
jgi:hypothetical protein